MKSLLTKVKRIEKRIQKSFVGEKKILRMPDLMMIIDYVDRLGTKNPNEYNKAVKNELIRRGFQFLKNK